MVGVALLAAGARAQGGLGELGELGEEAGRYPLEPPDTSSPRATLLSFLTDAREGWTIFRTSDEPARERHQRADSRMRRAALCLDLSEIPGAARNQVAVGTVVQLLDVLERIPLPPWRAIPDLAAVDREELKAWTVPHTRIELRRIEEGPRAGEFLFAPHTVARVPDFYERTRHLEPRDKAVVRNGWEIFRHLPGWMIPLSWVESLPDLMREDILGQALWQWLLLALTLSVAGAVIWVVRRWSRRRPSDGTLVSYLRRMAVPLTVVLIFLRLGDIAVEQIGLTGTTVTLTHIILRGIAVLGAAWLVMLAGSAVAEAAVLSPRIHPQSVDANLVRIAARLVSLVLAVLVAVEGARQIGLPVMGLLAGLGVGGLAVALAAQSTIENFIGSITIFADRPVRVGDFCRFGEEVGTVEEIGLRSTRVRTLGRSMMTIPNAEFSRLRLDNFTRRDRNLFRASVALHYETTPEQLREVLARLRELLLAHPRVLEEPARARLADFGSHAFEIEIFAYVDAPAWNEYLEIREELLLRITDAVEAAGTRLGVRVQTTYVASDPAVETKAADG